MLMLLTTIFGADRIWGTLKVQKIFGNGLAGIILPANILFVIGAKVVMIFAARAEAAIIDV